MVSVGNREREKADGDDWIDIYRACENMEKAGYKIVRKPGPFQVSLKPTK